MPRPSTSQTRVSPGLRNSYSTSSSGMRPTVTTMFVATICPANATSSTRSCGLNAASRRAIELVGDLARRRRDQAAPLEQQLLGLGHRRVVGVVARLDQDAAEEHRAHQAVVRVADRIREQRDGALADERLQLVAQRVPAPCRRRSSAHAPSSVRFMLVMRPPWSFSWRSAAACASGLELVVGRHAAENPCRQPMGRPASRPRVADVVPRTSRARRRRRRRGSPGTPRPRPARACRGCPGRCGAPAARRGSRTSPPWSTTRAPRDLAHAAVISAISGSVETMRTSSPRTNGRVRTSARAIRPAPR